MLEQTDSRAFDSESLITLILPRIKRFGKLALQNGYGEYSDLANLVTDGSQEVMVEDDGEPGPGGLGAPPTSETFSLRRLPSGPKRTSNRVGEICGNGTISITNTMAWAK